MVRLIPRHAKWLAALTIGLSLINILGGGLAFGADVIAPSMGNIYEVAIYNFGSVDVKGTVVEVSIVNNPLDLITIREVTPECGDIAPGDTQVFQIHFDVGCPPDNLDIEESALFLFAIHKNAPGPLYIKSCGINPSACSELTGSFSAKIKLTECEKCEDNIKTPKTEEEIGLCNHCSDGNIVSKPLPIGDKCMTYECNPADGSIRERSRVPHDGPCKGYLCDPVKGISLFMKPGCDHPDDNDSPGEAAQLQDSGSTLDSGPRIGILARGFFNESASIAGLVGGITDGVALDSIPVDIEKNPMLVIPSGGLYGMEKLSAVREHLENYTAAGGTLIVFAQQHGYEYEILPGELSGRGWNEDVSCQWRSMYVDTYHPILSGLDKKTIDAVVDGYFTDWPDQATILLSRTINHMPCMLLYPYGQGRVIVTSMYEDWAFEKGWASEDGRRILRDLLRWAAKPSDLPYFSTGYPLGVSMELTNRTNEPAAFVEITILNPDNLLFQRETILQNIDPGQSVIIPYSAENIPEDLGIWSVKAVLLNAEYGPIQTEALAARFVMSKSPQNNSTNEIDFSIASDSEGYMVGEEGEFTISVRNNGSSDREITACVFLANTFERTHDPIYGTSIYPFGSTRKTTLSIPAGGMQTLGVKIPILVEDHIQVRFYDENNNLMGKTARGFSVFPSAAAVSVQIDKNTYLSGEKVIITINYSAKNDWHVPADLHLKIIDPQGQTMLEENRPLSITDTEKKEVLEIPLGDPAKIGRYNVITNLYWLNKKIYGEKWIAFDVPKARFAVTPQVSEFMQNDAVDMNLVVDKIIDGVISPGAIGDLTVSLTGPNRNTLWSEQRTFPLSSEGQYAFDFPLPEGQILFGVYDLNYRLKYEDCDFSAHTAILCSAILAGSLDRQQYRCGEKPSLDVSVANNGRITLTDMNLNLSIPEFAVNENRTISLTPGQSSDTGFSFAIPESASAGLHYAAVTISKNGSTKQTCLWLHVPPSNISLSFSGSSFQAGQNIGVELLNSGGAGTTAEYSVELSDVFHQVIASLSGPMPLPIDTAGKIDMGIPALAGAGFYHVKALVRDSATGESRQYSDTLMVTNENTAEVALQVQTDQEVYTQADTKTITADLSLLQGSLEDGNLNLEIQSSEQIWTNREDWQAGEGYLVDIDSRPGEVLPAIPEGSEGDRTGTYAPDGRLKWAHDAGAEARTTPVIGNDGTVYANMKNGEAASGVLYTLRPDGSPGWTYATQGSSSYPPVVGVDGVVYIITQNILRAVKEGVELWTFSGNGEQLLAPVVGLDGTVYGATASGTVFALDPAGVEKWRHDQAGYMYFTPAVGMDGNLYLPIDRNNIYYIQALYPDGTEAWLYDAGAWFQSSPAVKADGTIYICTNDGHLHALYPDGTLKWKYFAEASFWSSPEFGLDGTIYLTLYSDQIRAVSPEGMELWRFFASGQILDKPAIGPDRTIYFTADGYDWGYDYGVIGAVNPDGSLHWAHRIPGRLRGGAIVDSHGDALAVGQNGRFYCVGGKGRSITLKIDAGHSIAWGRMELFGEESFESRVQVSTRTAESEAELAGASWTSYSPSGQIGSITFAADMASGPGRWLEIQLNFENAYRWGDQVDDCFPIIHALMVDSEAGRVVWSRNLPMALTETSHLAVPLTAQLAEGRYIVKGMLTNSLSQQISMDNHVFYINDDPIHLTFDTDKPLYRSGETVRVSGRVVNTLDEPSPGGSLSFQIQGALIFDQVIDLSGLGEYPFTFSFSAPESTSVLTGTLGIRRITLPILVGKPALGVNISPSRAGREPFDLGITLTNSGNMTAEVSVAVAGSTYPLTIPVGQSQVLTIPYSITADTNLPVTISGDIQQTFQHHIAFCEQVAVSVSPAAYYGEGLVEIPYQVVNTGCSTGTADIVFNLNNHLVTRTVFVPAGGSLSDTLTFNMVSGEYRLSYQSVFGSGSLPVKVLGTDQLDVRMEAGYPHPSKVLVLTDSSGRTDVERALLKDGPGMDVTRALVSGWDGTNPDPEAYDVVLLTDSNRNGTVMPDLGQGVLKKFVDQGGGLVILENVMGENTGNNQLAELFLYDPAAYETMQGADALTLPVDHPITAGITAPIQLPLLSGNGGALRPEATAVVTGTLLPNFLAVKALGLGRIVQFAVADSTTEGVFCENPAMQTLLGNGVRWSGRQAAPGKVNMAVLVRNRGANEFAGDLSITGESTDFTENLVLPVGQSRLFEFEISTTELAPGVYPLDALVSKIGLPVQQAHKEIEIDGPRLEVLDLPVRPAFDAGGQGVLAFAVRNAGMTGGPVDVGFALLDILDEDRQLWLAPGEAERLTYTFLLPDDLAAHDYKATLKLDGKIFEIPFRVNGLDIQAAATLDQPVYTIGDTAILTLEVVNHSALHPEMLARVVAGLDDYVQGFTPADSAVIQFSIPITEDIPEQLTYGLYMASGRSVLLNTMPVRLRLGAVSLYPDKAVYLPGETVVMRVLTSEVGELAVSAPGYSEILPVTGDTDFSFVLPQEMMAERYGVEYQLGEHAGVCPIYVNGFKARILEAVLDKPFYGPKDCLGLSLIADISHPTDVILKGWVQQPDGQYQPLFETQGSLPAGESRIMIHQAEFTALQAGIHHVVYTLYKADTLLELLTAAEPFEVQSAAVTGLSLNQSTYGENEPVQVQVATYACGPVPGRITLLLNGNAAVERDVDLMGEGTNLFDLGNLPMGKYHVTAKFTAGQLVSEKSAAFAVSDKAAPAKPTGLAANTIGNVIALNWNPNSERDLAGYYIYRNSVCLNAVAFAAVTYTDEGFFVETPMDYRVTAVDRAGNESPPSEKVTVLRDGRPPSIILSPEADTSVQHAISITYTVTDNHDPQPQVIASHPSPTIFYLSGDYLVRVQARDAAGNYAEKSVNIHIAIPGDSDGDGMDDAWELQYFGTLARTGSADYDGDGLTDLAEYQNGTDPVSSNAPPMPQVVYPLAGAEVMEDHPELAVENSTDPNGDAVFYTFEVYADEQMTELVARQADLPQASGYTTWIVASNLRDNTCYSWRVRAGDGVCFSSWVYGRFFVNTVNDPPAEFQMSRPMDRSEVSTRTPVLEVGNSQDPDKDVLTYRFEVYSDADMTTLVAVGSGVNAGSGGSTTWMVDTLLNDNTWYYWQVAAVDEHGAEIRTVLSRFFVNIANDAPQAPIVAAPADGTEVAALTVDLAIHNAVDTDGDALVYRFALDTVNTFDGSDLLVSEDIPAGSGTTAWQVTGLDDNTLYYWRVKAFDGLAESPWCVGRFFVNTANDAPGIPTLKNPGQGAWVDTLTPGLELQAVPEPDGDFLTYRFEVYADSGLNLLVATGETDLSQWVVADALQDNHWYYWRARVVDEHGAASPWTEIFRFFTDENGMDDPPAITITTPAADLHTNADTFLIRWEDRDPDSDADIALYYDTDGSGADGLPIVQGLSEDGDGPDDTWLWGTKDLADGVYYVYAVINDGHGPVMVSYSPGALIMDRTPPMVAAVPGGGVYESAQYVALAMDEAGTAYYTLDGSEPSTGAIPYAAPIEMNEDTVLKFMAVDTAGNSTPVINAQYTIRIPNQPPLAEAGEGRTVYLGETVSLDGNGSTDPDNGPMPLTYRWYFVTRPGGSTLTDADITNSNRSQAAFVPDVVGVYSVALEVYDGQERGTDSIFIKVALNNSFDRRSIVLLADELVNLEAGARVTTGHIVVLDQDQWGLRDLFKREIIVGNGAYTADGAVLFGDTVHIKPGASVDEVHYNDLRNQGTIRGATVAPLDLPSDLILPDFITSCPGTTKIEVKTGQVRVLATGAYGEVILKGRSSLVFTGGVYHLQSLDVGNDNCRVLFSAPTDLMIAGSLGPGQGAYIGPADGSGISAKDIRVYVQGRNKRGEPLPMAVMIGNHNILKAGIYALNGRIWVKNNSSVEGALIGKQILIGTQTQVSLDSGF